MFHYINKVSEVERSILFKAVVAHFGNSSCSKDAKGYTRIAEGVAYDIPPLGPKEKGPCLFGTNPETSLSLDSYMAGYQAGRLALDKMIDSVIEGEIRDTEPATEPTIRVRVADDACPVVGCKGHEPIEEE